MLALTWTLCQGSGAPPRPTGTVTSSLSLRGTRVINHVLEVGLLVTSMFVLLSGMAFDSGIMSSGGGAYTTLMVLVAAALVAGVAAVVLAVAGDVRAALATGKVTSGAGSKPREWVAPSTSLPVSARGDTSASGAQAGAGPPSGPGGSFDQEQPSASQAAPAAASGSGKAWITNPLKAGHGAGSHPMPVRFPASTGPGASSGLPVASGDGPLSPVGVTGIGPGNPSVTMSAVAAALTRLPPPPPRRASVTSFDSPQAQPEQP